KTVYIVKPDEGSQGEGIYIIKDPKDYILEANKRHLIQEYVANPMLIDGLKFDLRLYVVLTSIEPLTIYMSKDGLARFCTQPYKAPTSKNIGNPYIHLTNYSLNKKSKYYIHTESSQDGSKRSLSNVMKQIRFQGYDVDVIKRKIKDLVIKTLIAIAPDLKSEFRSCLPASDKNKTISCFQILGFDILLDSDGAPILLEVNSSPSLRLDFE
ncbi:hypothetical protein HELRODRAFT_134854, partial [Helobdella robusta]|uniref:Tubulin--tyrosine ligase-like protein 9 n=1 Tax=Helobdella robusta TaxID=6412 RepID=T1EI60_HELRO